MYAKGVIIGLSVCIAALVYVLLERDLGAKVQAVCVTEAERERTREIMVRGIDKGLENAILHLFDVWQKDPESDQPKRAKVGTDNALAAHARSRKAILTWNPPLC